MCSRPNLLQRWQEENTERERQLKPATIPQSAVQEWGAGSLEKDISTEERHPGSEGTEHRQLAPHALSHEPGTRSCRAVGLPGGSR